jgi:hypothetical protein
MMFVEYEYEYLVYVCIMYVRAVGFCFLPQLGIQLMGGIRISCSNEWLSVE